MDAEADREKPTMTSTHTTETPAAATEGRVTVAEVSGNELHCRYPGQTSAQPCHVELDCESGALCAEYDTEIGNAVPMRVYHGHVQRWGIPALRARFANALLEEIAPLAERVVAGYDSEWNGHNNVATFDADATAAMAEIGDLCERAESDAQDDGIRVWDAGDWYQGTGDHDAQRLALGITATTTDEELDAIEAREDASAQGNDCDVIEGHAKHLLMLRDEAREEATDDE